MTPEPQPDDTFEKLLVWRRAHALSIEVYVLLSACKDWGFKDQITRAANSIADNIAEGSERNGAPEFRQFLSYAKGSAGKRDHRCCEPPRLATSLSKTADVLSPS